jgi:hypothetical protein
MPKAPATRKVAKVARTGGGRTRRGQTSWVFPAFLTVVTVLGVFLIGFSRAQRQPDTTPPRTGGLDHWHSAIAFDICGTFASNLTDKNGQDPLGIHTHGDGVIHTHPFSSQSAGRRATLKVFFDTVGVEATETSIQLPGQDAKRNGQRCEDKPAELRVKVWDTRSRSDEGRIVTGDPGDIRLRNNQLITVAFLPEDAEIPRPPTEPELDRLTDLGPTTTLPTPSTAEVPTTTAATEPTTTSPPG